MRWLRARRVPLLPAVVSRLIRHLYAADIHWDAQLAPGVAVVHGIGLVIGHGAVVGAGCVLFQGVTIGENIDPETGRIGTPRLEAQVHVGPGAVLLGPITIGAGSKIAAGAVVTTDVPPNSVVHGPAARITARPSRRAAMQPSP
jgi:serine O-acetyltransferase